MKSLAILWNSSQCVKSEILKDLDSFAKIIDLAQIDLKDNYEEFVRACYESENMEKWKIDNKLLHMSSTNCSEITIIFMDIDKGPEVYHEKKKKYIFSNLQNMKDTIREKYKDKVIDYYFDIVFHCTDSTEEYDNILQCLKKFFKQKGDMASYNFFTKHENDNIDEYYK